MSIDEWFKNKFLYNKSFLNNIYFFLNKIKSIYSYRKSYSQGAMSLILDDIFKKKNDGFYIDVGCQHPIKNNNTYLLHKNGWHGINIDLDQFNIDIFNYNRPKDYNICAALSNEIKKKELFFYHHKSPINTLNKQISESQDAKVSEVKTIKTNTLDNIFQSSPFVNQDIDLLTIDVEGEELNVLKGFNLTKYKPRVIVLEYLDPASKKYEIPYNNLNKMLSSELYNFLIKNHYNLVNWVNGDLVFVSDKFDI